MSHAARLFALYPDLAGDHGGQAAGIAADITRRHRAGLGSREPPSKPPAGFDTWPVADQVAFLVRSLDQIDMGDARNFELDVYGRPTSDWRIVALERLGDAAVPALIDAAERDHRLTRWREQVVALGCCGKGGRQPDRVFAVSEVARNTLRRILRVRFLDPTADPEADEDTSDAADIARLRRYWARYGRLAFPDRMMATLTNPAAQPAARREAATTLVDSFSESDSSWSREPRRAGGPRPLIARYSSPTVAEAILAAMDRELTNMADPRPDRWERVEDEYVRALTELGDVRVAAELARRAGAATSAGSRLRLARAAHDLGVGGPLVAFTREVAAGTLHFPLPPDQDAATTAIRDLVAALIDCRTPEADAALEAMADPGHPYFPVVALGVLGDPDDRGRGGIWNRHQFCVTVLRHLLADQRSTGGHAYRRGNEVEELGPGKPRRFTPPGGADPARWVEHVERTVADDAADRLAELTVGLPEYHPLRRDADQVRADARAVLGKYVGRFRPITWSERSRWEMGYPGDVGYAPDVKPLGRPATAADVAAGRAVFHLNGSGKLADLKLPAWVVLKEGHAERDRPVCGLAVQAEVGPDGAVIYGAIFRHAIRTVKASEVERVEAETRD
jgi:hypothetical protein